MSKIFVQIASYRDPELIPTIKDCIAKAKHPENLTFGICWQRDETEKLDEFKDLPTFQILDVHWSKSKGLCWARSEIQKLWKGEQYTLQIDSHHRFLQNWDEELISMMEMTGSSKPIITTYAGMYSPKENKLLNVEPYKMVPDKFTPSGTILFYPHAIPNWQTLTKPIPARFVSGHFFFTLGKHCEEYKYDPNLYFAGDEISLSIRSFTLGYDLFHPHKTVIWHEYTREGRTKHWTDFDQSNKQTGKVDQTWWEMDNESKRRLRHLLKEEDNKIDLGVYGLGTVRSHRDYELYAGINFAKKQLHPEAKRGTNPPTNDPSDWSQLQETMFNLKLNIPQPAEPYKLIYIGIEDESGTVLYRHDMTSYSPQHKAAFTSFTKPFKWVCWPLDNEGNWKTRQDFALL